MKMKQRRPDRPPNDARGLALEVLIAVEAGAFADVALGRALESSALRGADRNLATLLVYGSLAQQLSLDHSLATYCDRPLESMDVSLRVLLRLGLFQLFFLDRVPAYAAVDASVNAARKIAPKAAGFVNAVLRRAGREGPAALPRGADDYLRKSIELSHPLWLVRMWTEELGESEAEALMRADNQAMPTVYRALCDRDEAMAELREKGLDPQPARFAPDAIVARHAGNLPGLAVLQGEASQMVVRYLAPQAGENILDACAAPGGKTCYIASLCQAHGAVTAVDPARGAQQSILRNLRCCGVSNVEIKPDSLENFVNANPQASFDAVLVDAPCSGLGTLREHPEIRWRRSLADSSDLAARQRSILGKAASTVRPGGRLVYATCTVSNMENDALVDGFLSANPDFSEDVPEAVATELSGLLDERGRLRTFPHRHGMSAFFAAQFRRVR